jgi:DNA gyrase inhibitor GyrI
MAKTKLTYRDLVMAAQSPDAAVRKQGFAAFQAWVKAAPQLVPSDRLTTVERDTPEQTVCAEGVQRGAIGNNLS